MLPSYTITEQDSGLTNGKDQFRWRKVWLAPEKKQKESALTLRKEMLEKLSIGASKTKRDISVMTRMDSKLVELLDILVKLNIFQSRSGAVASIVEKMLISQLDKFELLKEQLKRLDDVHETAMDIAQDVLGGEG